MVQRFKVTFSDSRSLKQTIKMEGDDTISLRFMSGEGSEFDVNEMDSSTPQKKYLLANAIVFGQGVDPQVN